MASTPVIPPHLPDVANGLIMSAIRGLRNGIICGVRIRLPYVIQAATYALIYRDTACVLFFSSLFLYELIVIPLNSNTNS